MENGRVPRSQRFRIAAALFASLLPGNALRCMAYRWMFGYEIQGARLGFATVIEVREASLVGCEIGRFNRFTGPMRIEIGPGARIETHNVFDCGAWAADAAHAGEYARSLTIQADTLITDHHFFDLCGSFVLGCESWIAGRGSQFWTHGLGKKDRDIRIGRQCYIGSAVRFSPGSGVGDKVTVGLGSVVTRTIEDSDVLVAGVPASVVRKGGGRRRIVESGGKEGAS
jgi:acetyltransferase-like isoleucine patch superfamily enzyme